MIDEVFICSCLLCIEKEEIVEYLFIDCPIAQIAWSMSPLIMAISIHLAEYSSIVDWIKTVLNPWRVLKVP